METSDADEITFDSTRRLCPDGSCVGVIGADGRCSECGASGTAEGGPGLGPEAFGGGCVSEDEPAAASWQADGAEQAAEGGYDPAQRRLCPDGSCIGLIGAEGRCSACGRAETA